MTAILLEGETGSVAHGTNIATSDHDLTRIVADSLESMFGIDNEVNSKHVRDHAVGERSEAGDTEYTVYPLRKFVKLAMGANPNVMPLLWTNIITHEDVCGIRDIREQFINRSVVTSHLGFATQLTLQLQGRKAMKSNRPELIEAYGFDTKSAGHAIRVMTQAIELLTTGGMVMPMLPENREHIVNIRTGKVPLSDVLAQVEDLKEQVRVLEDNVRPDTDHEAINAWLTSFYSRHYFSELAAAKVR